MDESSMGQQYMDGLTQYFSVLSVVQMFLTNEILKDFLTANFLLLVTSFWLAIMRFNIICFAILQIGISKVNYKFKNNFAIVCKYVDSILLEPRFDWRMSWTLRMMGGQ